MEKTQNISSHGVPLKWTKEKRFGDDYVVPVGVASFCCIPDENPSLKISKITRRDTKHFNGRTEIVATSKPDPAYISNAKWKGVVLWFFRSTSVARPGRAYIWMKSVSLKTNAENCVPRRQEFVEKKFLKKSLKVSVPEHLKCQFENRICNIET